MTRAWGAALLILRRSAVSPGEPMVSSSTTSGWEGPIAAIASSPVWAAPTCSMSPCSPSQCATSRVKAVESSQWKMRIWGTNVPHTRVEGPGSSVIDTVFTN